MLDFAALPPEVNSAKIYAGPGSAPMMAAAAAWDALAAGLESLSAGYATTITDLQGPWSGPSSAAMAAAGARYVAWATGTAIQAAHAGAQARTAAAAYEAAHAATVPPAVIAANRAQLAALVATNFFGQNTPAIAATEAHYAQMWAQDAAAMYAYAGSASTATEFTPFSRPPQTTNPAGTSSQTGALTQAAGTSTAHNAHIGAAALPGLNDLNTVIGPANFAWVTGGETAGNLAQFAVAIQGFVPSAAAPVLPVTSGTSTPGALGAPSPVLAGVGKAAAVGKLSVPQGWVATTPHTSLAAHPSAVAETGARGVVHRAGGPVRNMMVATPTPGLAPLQLAAGCRKGSPESRTQGWRFRMPRPAVGG
jgi:PPE-repeat protein